MKNTVIPNADNYFIEVIHHASDPAFGPVSCRVCAILLLEEAHERDSAAKRGNPAATLLVDFDRIKRPSRTAADAASRARDVHSKGLVPSTDFMVLTITVTCADEKRQDPQEANAGT